MNSDDEKWFMFVELSKTLSVCTSLPLPIQSNYLALFFQFLYLSLDHCRDLACGWNEEPVHVKDCHLVTLTRSKLKQTELENLKLGQKSVTLNVIISGCLFLLVILTILDK